MEFSVFISGVVQYFVDLYLFADSIYPFSDVNVSAFWLLEGTLLTSLAYTLFNWVDEKFPGATQAIADRAIYDDMDEFDPYTDEEMEW